MVNSYSTSVPPQRFGSTSAIVSENVHKWPPISSTVYCLAVRVFGGWVDDPRAGFLCVLIVTVDIRYAHHDSVREATLRQSFLLAGYYHGATAKRKLGPVVSYSRPFYKSEARQSQSTASRTLAYVNTGMTTLEAMDRLVFIVSSFGFRHCSHKYFCW
jgi:hypothetical protein